MNESTLAQSLSSDSLNSFWSFLVLMNLLNFITLIWDNLGNGFEGLPRLQGLIADLRSLTGLRVLSLFILLGVKTELALISLASLNGESLHGLLKSSKHPSQTRSLYAPRAFCSRSQFCRPHLLFTWCSPAFRSSNQLFLSFPRPTAPIHTPSPNRRGTTPAKNTLEPSASRPQPLGTADIPETSSGPNSSPWGHISAEPSNGASWSLSRT